MVETAYFPLCRKAVAHGVLARAALARAGFAVVLSVRAR